MFWFTNLANIILYVKKLSFIIQALCVKKRKKKKKSKQFFFFFFFQRENWGGGGGGGDADILSVPDNSLWDHQMTVLSIILAGPSRKRKNCSTTRNGNIILNLLS